MCNSLRLISYKYIYKREPIFYYILVNNAAAPPVEGRPQHPRGCGLIRLPQPDPPQPEPPRSAREAAVRRWTALSALEEIRSEPGAV